MLDTGFLAWLFAGAIVSGVLGSMLAGNLSGLLGIGGGIIKVPDHEPGDGIPIKQRRPPATLWSGSPILAGFARYALEPGQQTLASLGRAVPFRQFFFLLAQGRPEALLSLGILVLLFVPAGFVAAFCGRGERLSALTSGIVLAILLISATMGLL